MTYKPRLPAVKKTRFIQRREIVRTKSDSTYNVKLFRDTDSKLKKISTGKGVSSNSIICQIVENYFEKEERLPNDLQRQEEIVERLATLLRAHQESTSEQLANMQKQLVELRSNKTNDANANSEKRDDISQLHSELAQVNKELKSTQNIVTVTGNLLVEVAVRAYAAEHILLHDLTDPHIQEIADSVTIKELIDATENPDKYLTKATSEVRNHLHVFYRSKITAIVKKAHTELKETS
ncbi:MAG: hypothetical protein MSG64_12075 [Pyrinomonadaceae bacterium MAG19_C2-C3]|nr:hypothetical protein [Pyrinomonadaceae bacterium MAG19_C2-C3]